MSLISYASGDVGKFGRVPEILWVNYKYQGQKKTDLIFIFLIFTRTSHKLGFYKECFFIKKRGYFFKFLQGPPTNLYFAMNIFP